VFSTAAPPLQVVHTNRGSPAGPSAAITSPALTPLSHWRCCGRVHVHEPDPRSRPSSRYTACGESDPRDTSRPRALSAENSATSASSAHRWTACAAVQSGVDPTASSARRPTGRTASTSATAPAASGRTRRAAAGTYRPHLRRHGASGNRTPAPVCSASPQSAHATSANCVNTAARRTPRPPCDAPHHVLRQRFRHVRVLVTALAGSTPASDQESTANRAQHANARDTGARVGLAIPQPPRGRAARRPDLRPAAGGRPLSLQYRQEARGRSELPEALHAGTVQSLVGRCAQLGAPRSSIPVIPGTVEHVRRTPATRPTSHSRPHRAARGAPAELPSRSAARPARPVGAAPASAPGG
jgi:hypothetical protein